MMRWMNYQPDELNYELRLNPEAAQLVNQAAHRENGADPLLNRALAGFGAQLSQWGERLQTRYGHPRTSPGELRMAPCE
jgi:hypothetical protein